MLFLCHRHEAFRRVATVTCMRGNGFDICTERYLGRFRHAPYWSKSLLGTIRDCHAVQSVKDLTVRRLAEF